MSINKSTIIVLLIFVVTSLQSQDRTNPTIGVLNKSHINGCGCYFGFENDTTKSLVFESEGDENSAWLNINGNDIEFKFMSSTFKHTEYKLGTTFTKVYSNGTFTVEIKHKVTRLPTKEDYEWTKMNATIIVKDGSLQTVVKCKGGCGC